MLAFLLALLAGIVTIGGPCILPLLPILLGTSTTGKHALRPFAIVFGFVCSFTVFALVFSLFGTFLGLSPETWRWIAVSLISVFGLLMLFPSLQARLFSGFEQKVNEQLKPGQNLGKRDLLSGFVLGASLGALWTPCAGPVLGSILTLVASKQNVAQSAALLFAFSLGAGIPMLLIAYGGQLAVTKVQRLSKYTGKIQRVFGVLLLVTALAIARGWDTQVQTYLLVNYPWLFLENRISFTQEKTQEKPLAAGLPILAERMPEFQKISRWWNTPNDEALTPESLKGKVTIIDFWTYSCINCIRTQPVLKAWYQAYKQDGLEIVGVHTPEFAFEKDPENVDAAIKKAGLTFPIALDPEYETWSAYQNQYWPAKYIFDRQGRLRYTHFGEGKYEETEKIIRELLAEDRAVLAPMTGADSSPDFASIKTRETYFGSSRRENLANRSSAPMAATNTAMLTLSPTLQTDEWTIGGAWKTAPDYIESAGETVFRMKVEANAMHLVLGSTSGTKRVQVLVEGQGEKFIDVGEYQLYTVARWDDAKVHTVELKLPAGVQMYAATFGE